MDTYKLLGAIFIASYNIAIAIVFVYYIQRKDDYNRLADAIIDLKNKINHVYYQIELLISIITPIEKEEEFEDLHHPKEDDTAWLLSQNNTDINESIYNCQDLIELENNIKNTNT